MTNLERKKELERKRERERQCLDTLKIATSVLYKTVAVLNCFLIGRSSSSGEQHRSLLLANTTKSELISTAVVAVLNSAFAHLLNISPTQTFYPFCQWPIICTRFVLPSATNRIDSTVFTDRFSSCFLLLPFTSVIFIHHHHYIILNNYLHHHNHHTTVHTSLTSTHLFTAATAERK